MEEFSVIDIIHLLQAIQQRRLVTKLCADVGKPRAWFYRAMRGETSVIQHLDAIQAVLNTPLTDIATLREQYSVSQAELSRLLNVTRQTVSGWEKRPTASRIERCKRVLETSALRSTDHPTGDN